MQSKDRVSGRGGTVLKRHSYHSQEKLIAVFKGLSLRL
jgi:hypothetical protein